VAEINIKPGEIFELARFPKRSTCQVKGCRKRRDGSHALCACHLKRLWRSRNPVKAAFNNLRGNAKRRHLFRNGVRIPWDEIDLSEFEQSETQRRKGFVAYFQNGGGAEPPGAEISGNEEWPEWLRYNQTNPKSETAIYYEAV
jgi:hypothetical protein